MYYRGFCFGLIPLHIGFEFINFSGLLGITLFSLIEWGKKSSFCHDRLGGYIVKSTDPMTQVIGSKLSFCY